LALQAAISSSAFAGNTAPFDHARSAVPKALHRELFITALDYERSTSRALADHGSIVEGDAREAEVPLHIL
jgi:hypothetical protein